MEGRLFALNPAGERLCERSASELIGEHFSVLLPSEELPIAQRLLEQVLSGTAEQVTEELQIVRPSGEKRLLSLVDAPTRDGDHIVGVHGIARDITDERAREQHLRRIERLAGVGTLIAGVAHELNNPLSAVLRFTRLLLMDPRPESERVDLETIVRETERMAKIVADLRLVARGAQEKAGKRQRLDLNDVVRHVLKTREYTHRTRNIEVKADLASDLPGLWADQGQMEQVLLNLVVNAEQAMDGTPGAHRLIVRTRRTSRGGVSPPGSRPWGSVYPDPTSGMELVRPSCSRSILTSPM